MNLRAALRHSLHQAAGIRELRAERQIDERPASDIALLRAS